MQFTLEGYPLCISSLREKGFRRNGQIYILYDVRAGGPVQLDMLQNQVGGQPLAYLVRCSRLQRYNTLR